MDYFNEVPAGGYWYLRAETHNFEHVRAGAVLKLGEPMKSENIDYSIDEWSMMSLIKYITEHHPQLITSYSGRDKEDIAIINRLIDILEGVSRK